MKKTTLTYLFLTGLLVVTSGIALTNGASHFSLLALSPTAQNTLFNIRLPRILAALLAGATVAVSGALFQAALRNPIADPGIMGSPAGRPCSPCSVAWSSPASFSTGSSGLWPGAGWPLSSWSASNLKWTPTG